MIKKSKRDGLKYVIERETYNLYGDIPWTAVQLYNNSKLLTRILKTVILHMT